MNSFVLTYIINFQFHCLESTWNIPMRILPKLVSTCIFCDCEVIVDSVHAASLSCYQSLICCILVTLCSGVCWELRTLELIFQFFQTSVPAIQVFCTSVSPGIYSREIIKALGNLLLCYVHWLNRQLLREVVSSHIHFLVLGHTNCNYLWASENREQSKEM